MADLFSSDQDIVDFGVGAGPGRQAQVLRFNPKTRQRHLDMLTWGLLPCGTEDPSTAPRPIHARAETIAELSMFANAFRHRRCIVPASEYYQKATKRDIGRRYGISRRDRQPMAIAGLWESHVMPEGDIIRTYCIVTTESNALVARIHDRMLLVLDESAWALWLGEAPGDPMTLLEPTAAELLVIQPLANR